MNPYTSLLLKISFITTTLFALAGALLKFLHLEGADVVFVVAIAAAAVFLLTALSEIIRSRKLSVKAKLAWSLGLVLMMWVMGLVYLLAARKSIAPAREL